MFPLATNACRTILLGTDNIRCITISTLMALSNVPM